MDNSDTRSTGDKQFQYIYNFSFLWTNIKVGRQGTIKIMCRYEMLHYSKLRFQKASFYNCITIIKYEIITVTVINHAIPQ